MDLNYYINIVIILYYSYKYSLIYNLIKSKGSGNEAII